MLSVFAVDSEILEVVVAYSNHTLPTSHIVICMDTHDRYDVCIQYVDDAARQEDSWSDTWDKDWIREFMARNDVLEIGGRTLGVRLECSFTVVTLQLVNNTGLQVLAPCVFATISTRKGQTRRSTSQ
jgi:hypothetical protein